MPSPPNKNIKHRRAIKKFFITFPKSQGLPKDVFYQDISQQFPANKAICAEEEHSDKTPHLHLAIEFNDFVTKYQLLQHLQKQYPDDYKRIDVQSMKSMKHSVTYLTSPDKDKHVDPTPFLYNIQLEDNSSAKHQLFEYQFKDDPPIYWAPSCMCKICTTLIKLHNFTEFQKSEEPFEIT